MRVRGSTPVLLLDFCSCWKSDVLYVTEPVSDAILSRPQSDGANCSSLSPALAVLPCAHCGQGWPFGIEA